VIGLLCGAETWLWSWSECACPDEHNSFCEVKRCSFCT